MNVVDAYVKILSKDRQVEVTLARAGTVLYKQARSRGTPGIRTGGAAAKHCTGFRTRTCNKGSKNSTI